MSWVPPLGSTGFPLSASVLVICCYNSRGGIKQHAFLVSRCLWVRRLGTADLGRWLQAFSTKTEPVSSSTEIPPVGLAGGGSAAKLMGFEKTQFLVGCWNENLAVSCQPEAILAT